MCWFAAHVDFIGQQRFCLYLACIMQTLSKASENVDSTQWRGWFDGAAEPTNPGNRSIGVFLEGPNGTVVQLSRSIGFGTNNEAEYEAIIALMESAIEAGAPSVQIFGDSQLVVNQLNGTWAVRSASLHSYWFRAVDLMRKSNATISWVPREQNTKADELSKRELGPVLKRDAEWGSLTAIGKALGISAVAVGKKLTALGFKDGKRVTEAAVTGGVGRVRETLYGTQYEWHVHLATELLRAQAAEPKPAAPLPSTTEADTGAAE